MRRRTECCVRMRGAVVCACTTAGFRISNCDRKSFSHTYSLSQMRTGLSFSKSTNHETSYLKRCIAIGQSMHLSSTSFPP